MADADTMRPRDTDAMSSPRLDFKTRRPDVSKLPSFELPHSSRFSIPVPIDTYQVTQGSSSTSEGTSLPSLSSLISEYRSDSASPSSSYSCYEWEGPLMFPPKNFESSLPPFLVPTPTTSRSLMSALVPVYPERSKTGLATPTTTPPFSSALSLSLSLPHSSRPTPSYNLSELAVAPSPSGFSYPTLQPDSSCFSVFRNLPDPQGPTTLMGSFPPELMYFNSAHTANMQDMYNVPSQITQSTGRNDRPFKCEQCPQSFNRNHDLKRHKRIHLAVKPFPCAVCDKSFSRKDALKRHFLVKGCRSALKEQEHKRLESPTDSSPSVLGTADRTVNKHMDAKPPSLPAQWATLGPTGNAVLFKKPDTPKATANINISELIDAPHRDIQIGTPDHDSVGLASPRAPSASSSSASIQQSESSMASDGTDDDAVSVITDYSEYSVMSTENFQESPAQTYLRAFGLAVARNVLIQIRTILDNSSGFTSRTAESSSSSMSQINSSQTSTSNSRSASVKKKRARENDDSEPPGDGSGNGPNKRRNIATIPDDSLLLRRLLACPFYKRNPDKHKKWRSCAGPGWQTIHRLKEHIYRRHALPVVCPRCGTQFETEEAMQKHSKEPIPCEVSQAEAADGYNKEQEKQLRGRKRPANQTDEERWYDMYSILFPKDPPLLVPSPYYESQEMQIQGQLVKFKEYLKDELPKKMWTDLQSDLQPLGDVRMTDMQRKIEEMVRECTDSFFLQCQRSFLSPPSTPRPSELLRRIPSSPLLCDTLSEESGISNRLTAPAAAVHASPTHTANFESNSDATFSSRDGWGYVPPPASTAFTAYTVSPAIPPTPDTNGRFGFINQEMWNAPYLAPPGPLMGQCGVVSGRDDGTNVDYGEIMHSLGLMNSGQGNQFPGSGCI